MYITTNSGLSINLIEADPSTIDIQDIAFSLARIRRFNGHTEANCSVALHSCMVAQYLLSYGHTSLARWGLMHDAEEAYTGDICTPWKPYLSAEMKQQIQSIKNAIIKRFNIRTTEGKSWVKYFDLVSLKYEKENYLNSSDDWSILQGVDYIEPNMNVEYYMTDLPDSHEELFLKFAEMLGIK